MTEVLECFRGEVLKFCLYDQAISVIDTEHGVWEHTMVRTWDLLSKLGDGHPMNGDSHCTNFFRISGFPLYIVQS